MTSVHGYKVYFRLTAKENEISTPDLVLDKQQRTSRRKKDYLLISVEVFLFTVFPFEEWL